jgi:hypothetical protein
MHQSTLLKQSMVSRVADLQEGGDNCERGRASRLPKTWQQSGQSKRPVGLGGSEAPPVPQRGGLPLGFGQKILVPILGQS